MILLLGIGNTGDKYSKNRHNVGFMTIDKLVDQYFTHSNFKKNKNSSFISGSYHDMPIILAKPNTFVNLSGKAVLELISFYKITLDNIIVLQDDIDSTVGALSYKINTSHGGHNGIRNIIQTIGNGFHKLKIGVGRPDNPNIPVADYVLSNFTSDEFITIDNTINYIVNSIDLIINKNFQQLINNYK